MERKKTALILIVLLIAITMAPLAGARVPAYESKYAKPPEELSDGCGALFVLNLAHHNVFSREMILYQFESGQRANISFRPDGKFDDRYLPGRYNLTLLDGNGGQPERTEFKITKGGRTDVIFIGHAISGPGKKEPVCHEEQIWHCGYWTWDPQRVCHRGHCWWVWIPVWHPGYWETITVCEGETR